MEDNTILAAWVARMAVYAQSVALSLGPGKRTMRPRHAQQTVRCDSGGSGRAVKVQHAHPDLGW